MIINLAKHIWLNIPPQPLIPTIFKVDNAYTYDIPCVLISLSTEDIYLTKGEILRFVIELMLYLVI